MEREELKHRRVNAVLVIVAGLLTLIIVPTVVSYIFSGPDVFSSLPVYIKHIGYGFTIGLLFWIGNWAIGTVTGKRLDWAKKLKTSNLISLLSLIFYGILVSILFPYVVHRYVFHQTGQNLRYTVAYNAFLALSVDLIVISIYYSRYLVFYWKMSIKKYEEVKREHLVAKYEALKNQVNPHFLFNSLNTLSGIVEKDQETAVHFIKKLSDIYRYVLEQRDKELVVLGEEINFVEDYIYLAKMRHGEGLRISIDISSRQKYVLPLGIQILVENSIKHNIVSDNMPLNISIKEEGAYIVVKNNLQRKKVVQPKNAIGLENLKKRYEYLTDKPVEILESEDNFMVMVPIIDSTNELPDN